MDNILIRNEGWYRLMYNPNELYVYIEIEYNTDTSAHYPNRGNDIVRTCIKDEVQESVDKEPLR